MGRAILGMKRLFAGASDPAAAPTSARGLNVFTDFQRIRFAYVTGGSVGAERPGG